MYYKSGAKQVGGSHNLVGADVDLEELPVFDENRKKLRFLHRELVYCRLKGGVTIILGSDRISLLTIDVGIGFDHGCVFKTQILKDNLFIILDYNQCLLYKINYPIFAFILINSYLLDCTVSISIHFGLFMCKPTSIPA
jgi:hypothetical protein